MPDFPSAVNLHARAALQMAAEEDSGGFSAHLPQDGQPANSQP